MHRRTASLVLAVMVAGCSSAAVQTERADRSVIDITGDGPVEPPPAPSTGSPGSEPAGSSTSGPTSAPRTDPPVASDPQNRNASTSAGDPLFPGLGSADVDVQSYDVELDLRPAGGVIEGAVTIDAIVPLDVGQLALDAFELDISAVTVDGEDAPFETTIGELAIDLPADRDPEVTAVVTYRVTPGASGGTGLGAGWYSTAAGSYVLNEPDGAHRWMPSNDHPADKALWRFELQTADGVAAIANGALEQRGDSERPWIWNQAEPMATYLVQLIVGDYAVITGEPLASVDGDVIPLVHAAPSGSADRFEAYFAVTPDQFVFFEELFGPYPLDRYGLAFVDGFPQGVAMETQGRSMFSAADFDSATLGPYVELLLAHEMAHQWFGDAVSPASWSDIWLNESFATYAQWLWLEHQGYGDLPSTATGALSQRQNGGAATGTPAADNLFSFESYDGGAVVLQALRLTIGDDEFFGLLRRWVAEYAGTSQTTATFIALAEEVSGLDLTQFFEDWLYATDLPDRFPG